MVTLLLGQLSDYIKYPCLLCIWDSRAKHEHWVRKDWPSIEDLVVGEQIVIKIKHEIELSLHHYMYLMKQLGEASRKRILIGVSCATHSHTPQ